MIKLHNLIYSAAAALCLSAGAETILKPGDNWRPIRFSVTNIKKGSILYDLYGEEAVVNSAHHQCVKQLGKGLVPIQWCPEDNILEAFVHESLPILGVQWHPERIKSEFTTTSGDQLLAHFLQCFT